MSELTLHNLDPELEAELSRRASAHRRTLEAEVQEILRHSVAFPFPVVDQELLQRRYELAQRFISGEWGVNLEGLEDARARERVKDGGKDQQWR